MTGVLTPKAAFRVAPWLRLRPTPEGQFAVLYIAGSVVEAFIFEVTLGPVPCLALCEVWRHAAAVPEGLVSPRGVDGNLYRPPLAVVAVAVKVASKIAATTRDFSAGT